MKTEKYVRKPFDVDAVQVTAENMEEVAKWCKGKIETTEDTKLPFIRVDVPRVLTEKQTKAFVGDWVLYAGSGFKIYTNRAFKGVFVPAEKDKPQELRTVNEPVEATG